LECAGVDVAQHQVGRAGGADGSDTRELPIQPNRADGGGARELIVVDVVDLQCAGALVAQQEIAFAGDAAEVADARELPIRADRADEGGAGDLIVADVVNLQSTGIGVAHEQIVVAVAAEIADARELPIQADCAQEGGADDLIVIYVVDLELAGIDVGQQHVGFAEAAEEAEGAETHDLPIQPHCAQRGRTYDVVVGNVIDLKCAADGVAQQHVAGIAQVEIAESDKPPIAPDLTKRGGPGQDAVGPEVVDLVGGGGSAGVAQDHVGRGGGRRG